MIKNKTALLLFKIAIVVFFIIFSAMILVSSTHAYTLIGKGKENASIITDEGPLAATPVPFEVEHIATFEIPHQPKMGAIETAEINIFGLPLLVGGVSTLIVNDSGVTFSLGMLLKMVEEIKKDDYTVTEIEIVPEGERKPPSCLAAPGEEELATYTMPIEIDGMGTTVDISFFGMKKSKKFQPKNDIDRCLNAIVFNEEGLPINMSTLIRIVNDIFKDGYMTTRIVVNNTI